MAIMTLAEIKKTFRSRLLDLTDLNPEMIREAYADTGDGPFIRPGQTALYYYVQPHDDPINRQVDTTYQPMIGGGLKQTLEYNRVLDVQVVAYGPGGYDILCQLRLRLLRISPVDAMRQAGLYLVPDIAEPVALWEPYEGSIWIPRADLRLRYNQKITDEAITQAVSGLDVILKTEQTERKIEIEEGD